MSEEELILPYPFSKTTLYIVFIITFFSTLVSLYLVFNTTIIVFILSYLLSLLLLFLLITFYNFYNLNKIGKIIEREGRYIIVKRKKSNLLLNQISFIIITLAPFIAFLLFDPTIVLGLILGSLCAWGYSRIILYFHVKNIWEPKLGGELVIFLSPIRDDQTFVKGIKVIKY